MVGDNGIITNAQSAKIASENASWLEEAQMICVDAYAQADDVMTLTEEELEELGDDEEAIENLKKNKMVNYLLTQFNKKSQSGNVFVGARDDGFFVIDGDRYAVIDEKFNLSLIGDGVTESTENYLISSTEEWLFSKIDESNCAITAYLGEELSGVMVIPSIVIDKESGQAYNVTALGDDIFSSSYISGVDFSAVQNTLKSIGNRTFMRCTNLTIQVPGDLPSTVTKIGDSAFNGCKKLTGVIDDVIAKNYRLGTNTFANCPGLTGSIQLVFDQNYPKTADIGDVTTLTEEQTVVADELLKGLDGLQGELVIPSYITKIGASAFEDCKGITSLTFEGADGGTSSLTEIGENAFYNCIGITNSLVFPSTLTILNEYAFYNCCKLTGVTLNEALNKIGARCFSHCSKLTGIIIIPYGIEETEEYIFYDTGIQSLVFQTKLINNVSVGCKTIGISSFGECIYLTSITFPNTLKTIGKESFYRLGGYRSITLSFPDSLEDIGSNAFRLCSKLNISHWSSSMRAIGDSAFCYGRVLATLPDSTNLVIIGPSAFEGNKIIKKSEEEKTDIIQWIKDASKLITVSSNAFKDCGNLTGFWDLEKTTTEIFGRNMYVADDAFAFSGVTKGGKFVFSANQTIISESKYRGWNAFYDEDGLPLSTLTIPEGITTIKQYAFLNTGGIEKIILPSTLTTLEGGFNFQATRAKQIIFSGTLIEDLPKQCFYNCSITSITLPEGLKTVGDNCFAWCGSLRSVTLPSTLEKIDYGAFSWDRISSLNLPNSLKTIGNLAFYSEPGAEDHYNPFTTLVIPNSVISIGDNCFSGCIDLQTVVLSNKISTLPAGCFKECEKLTSITFNRSITSFGDNCFSGCKLLNSIKDTSKTDNVFDWGLVTYVGDGSFKNCTAMRGIYTINRAGTVGETATAGCNEELFYIHK